MDATQLESLIERLAALLDEMRKLLPGDNTESDGVTAFTLEEYERHIKEKLCLRCSKPLGDKPNRRGLHESCYQNYIRAKVVAIAEANRRIMPKKKPGKNPGAAIPPTKSVREIKDMVMEDKRKFDSKRSDTKGE